MLNTILSFNRCHASIDDLSARRNGCSEYERRLRSVTPVDLYGSPEMRDLSIRIDALIHKWGAR